VSPSRGPSEGNTEILIVGIGFDVNTEIYIGGVACHNLDFVDQTKFICDTPANPAGIYDIKAVSDIEEATLENGFEYFSPVIIDDIVPERGPVAGGMPATVTGSGFTAETQVSIGGRVVLASEFVSAEEIRFLTPPGVAGDADVRISNRNGVDELFDAFSYYEPVSIDAILPGAGPSTGGYKVLIEGAGFEGASDLSVMFGLLSASFELTEEGDLSVTVPAGPANSFVDVVVSSTDSGTDSVINGFYFYGSDAADFDVFNVQPTFGPTSGGTEVVLSGVGLGDVDSVTFGGEEVSIEVAEASYVIVTTEPESEGLVDIVISDGDDTVTLTEAFEFIHAPTINSIAPNKGDVAGGTAFVLSGSGFEAGSTVRFGALAASSLQITSDEISGLTPPGAVGFVDLTVTTPSGQTATLEDGFRYTGILQVHGFSPTRGSISGGTYAVIRGANFAEPLTVTFDDFEAADVQLLDSASLAVRTPAHEEGYARVTVTVGDGEPVTAADRFLFFDPSSNAGGSWGDPIDGAVNITVVSDNGQPLGGAYVTLSVRPDSPYEGFTDANGQITISGPDVIGTQTVSATRVGFSSSTVQGVNAENVTVILSCVPGGQCLSNDDCPDSFICVCGPPYSGGFPGVCLEETYCGVEIESQEQFDDICSQDPQSTPRGIIVGNLTGVHKVDDPGPGERIMGMVVTTQPHPLQGNPVSAGSGNVMEDDGPYTLYSRLGEVAVIGVCGIYNDHTNTFHPRFMGVRRGLFIVEDETYEIDIDCNIELTEEVTVKAVNPPLAPGGPNNLTHQLWLHFGSEGYYGLPNFTGTADTMSDCCYAPLEGQLAGLDYFVLGQALTGTSWPYSRVLMEGVTDLESVINLYEFTPVADLVTPRDGGTLTGRYLEWKLPTSATPDFYYLLLYDFNQTTYWDVYVPGDQTTVNLPLWGTGSVGAFPAGQYILQVLAADAKSFNYDQFDLNDFSLTNWKSYSVNAFLVINPG
ncbi:MAG: IPT/TIG domain-containing protein, partial [Myxococcales bacterium]|nr:IPT/TIG domain-containing protein [Myxococcales bacterium]